MIATVLVVGAVVSWYAFRMSSGPAAQPVAAATGHKQVSAPAKPPFDFYLLALTVHPAFCADGRAHMRECRARSQRPLVIHGLWPENLAPRTYPRDCPTHRLELDPALEVELADWMPGIAANLHEHEWRKHGGCSGLDDDEFFRRSIDLARVLDGALGARLTTLAGETTTPEALREYADLHEPGIGSTFTLHCRTLRDAPPELRGQPFLVEIRQCVDNDGPGGTPGTLLDCARLPRHDQGCGSEFRIAGGRT